MHTALALLNPHAAGGRAAAWAPRLRQWLPAGVPLHQPPDVAAARALLATQSAGRRVLLLGGDGSVHALLPELWRRRLELALLPVGSGNDTARALGLRRGPSAASVQHALQAEALPMDLGEVRTDHETRLFASSLAAGFDAAIALRARAGPRWLRGTPRYLWATLQELAALQPWRITAMLDGAPAHEGEALFCSVLNSASYGAGMPVAPAARLDDGMLDLVCAGRFGRLGALGMLPRLLTGTHTGHPRIRLLAGRKVELSSATALPLAADGEPMQAAAHVQVRVLPGALRAVRG